jgi:hypothetical protein
MPQKTLPVAPPAALVAYRAQHAALRAACLAQHAPLAQQLSNSIRANWLARAAQGCPNAVLICLMQGW